MRLFIFSLTLTVIATVWGDDFKPSVTSLTLEDDDTFVFIGNSITHQCLYTQYVENYFYTRYPEKHLTNLIKNPEEYDNEEMDKFLDELNIQSPDSFFETFPQKVETLLKQAKEWEDYIYSFNIPSPHRYRIVRSD